MDIESYGGYVQTASVFLCVTICLSFAIKFITFKKCFRSRQFVQVNPEQLVGANRQTVVIGKCFNKIQ